MESELNFVEVKIGGEKFHVLQGAHLLVGTSAKVCEPPPEGWDGVESGFGREFFYKIELVDGSVYFRRFPDQNLEPVATEMHHCAQGEEEHMVWLRLNDDYIVEYHVERDVVETEDE